MLERYNLKILLWRLPLIAVSVFLMFLLSDMEAYSQEQAGFKKHHTSPVKTNLVLLKPENISDAGAVRFTEKLRNKLSSIEGMQLSDESVPENKIQDEPKDFSAVTQRTIRGSVRLFKRYYREKESSEGAGQYLLEEKLYAYLSFEVELYDNSGNTRIAVFSETTKGKSIDRALEIIRDRIAEYYILDPPPPEPVIYYSFRGGAMFMKPRGLMNVLAERGAGFSTTAEMRNYLFADSVFAFNAGFINFVSDDPDLESLNSVFLSADAGYIFMPFKNSEIITKAGSGLYVHFLKNIKQENEYFFDPFVSLTCEFNYRIFKRFYLYLSPGYMLLFEKNNTGRIISADLGIKYLL